MGSNGFEQMRSGILEIRKALHKMYIGEIPLEKHTISAVIGRCDSLLELPLRNCDVGTIKEQTSRFDAFCENNMQHYTDMFGDGLDGWDCKKDCPVGRMIDSDHAVADRCQLAWAQQQYRENEDN